MQRSVISIIFLNLIIWKKFPNIRTLQEKRSSKGFHMEFLGADLCTLRSCCKNGDRGGIWERGCASVWWGWDSAAWKNGLCRDLESRAVARANKEGGENRCRQLLLNVLVRERLGNARQPLSTTSFLNKPLGHKEREGEVVDFNVLVETETLAPHALRRRRRTAFSCCRGNRLQRSVPEWRFSSSVLNRRPPQAELQPRVAEERRRSVRTESFRQRQARTCTAANQSLVAAERGRLLT